MAWVKERITDDGDKVFVLLTPGTGRFTGMPRDLRPPHVDP